MGHRNPDDVGTSQSTSTAEASPDHSADQVQADLQSATDQLSTSQPAGQAPKHSEMRSSMSPEPDLTQEPIDNTKHDKQGEQNYIDKLMAGFHRTSSIDSTPSTNTNPDTNNSPD